jgi:hypothetical protein
MDNDVQQNELIDYEECNIDIQIKNNDNNNSIEIKMDEENKFVPRNWFEKIFGFTESNNNNDNINKMKEIYVQNNNAYCINDIPTGIFSVYKNSDLHQLFNNNNKKSKEKYLVSLENIVGDIKNIYRTPDLCRNAIFQIETLSNYLGNDNNKLTSYEIENFPYLTYTPTGLAYRNYVNPSQHNMFFSFFDYLENINPNINHTVKDGYLHFEHENELKKINRILSHDIDKRRDIRKTIISGIHKNQGVVIDGVHQPYTITNILNCGIPINKNNFDADLWKGVVELYLEGIYENALLLAHQHNIETKSIGTCYLTPIGEELGADKYQIVRAIQRACHIMALKGIKLNIKLVHKNNIADVYTHLPKQYPLNVVHVNSIWDNNTWTNKSV